MAEKKSLIPNIFKKKEPEPEKPSVPIEEELILRRLSTLADLDLKKTPPTSEDVMMDLSILARGELLILVKLSEILHIMGGVG